MYIYVYVERERERERGGETLLASSVQYPSEKE